MQLINISCEQVCIAKRYSLVQKKHANYVFVGDIDLE